MSEKVSWIERFGVKPVDPGFIYVIESNRRFKIGRSRSRHHRLAVARTWLPDMELIGIKPFWNVREIERCFHVGFAACWYSGEWFVMLDGDYHRVLVDGFRAFHETDRDNNSIDFIYWFNGDGMAEFVHEQARQRLCIRQFQARTSGVTKVFKL